MRNLFLFVIVPVVLTILGEFFLKVSVTNLQFQLDHNSVKVLITNPGIITGILMIIVGGVLWLVAMSKYELSFIYPFLSLQYLFLVVGSKYYLGEQVPLIRIVAMMLIMLGLVVISRSPNAEVHRDTHQAKEVFLNDKAKHS